MPFDLIDELAGVIAAMDAAAIPYAVCGGLALGILGYPRATIDIDLLITPEDVDRAKAAVHGVGFAVPARHVVTREGLATMKRLAGRPRDLADLAILEGRAEDEEDA